MLTLRVQHYICQILSQRNGQTACTHRWPLHCTRRWPSALQSRPDMCGACALKSTSLRLTSAKLFQAFPVPSCTLISLMAGRTHHGEFGFLNHPEMVALVVLGNSSQKSAAAKKAFSSNRSWYQLLKTWERRNFWAGQALHRDWTQTKKHNPRLNQPNLLSLLPELC